MTLLGVPAAQVAKAQTPISLSWEGYFWDNRSFSGAPKVYQVYPALNFNWATGSPIGGIPADNFSARFYSNINVTTAGTFRLRAGADDGVKVAIDGTVYLDKMFETNTFNLYTLDMFIGPGPHQLVIDYFDATGNAGMLFEIIPVTGQGGPINQVTQPTATPFGTPVSGGGTGSTVPSGVSKGVIIVAKANVRSGPGTNFAQIGEAYKDQQFVVVGKNGNYGFQTWFLVELPGGGRGWIARSVMYVYGTNTDAIPITKETIEVPTTGGATTTQVTGLARTNIAVRDGPSTRNAKRIAVLDKGTSFVVIGLSTNRAWVKIDYNGLIGWVYLPNVSITSGSLSNLPRGNS
ncbi:MAG: SH3 domain-containing protein [Anaerolineae bacterium]|nr:SH3 domain-containing protein [Anaerolineae bacterium]